MLRNRNKPGAIGIDIGAASVKMVQLAEQGGQPLVQACAHLPIDAGAEEGEGGASALATAISEGLRRGGFRGRQVAIALSGGEFQMKSIRLPPMPAEEKESAVQFESQDRFNLGPGGQIRFIAAGEVRHGNELKEELMVFAARDEVIASKLSLLDSLRLRATAIDIAPCAVARSFSRFLRRAEDSNAVNVFLDVGYSAASILITRGTDLSFMKVLEVGGRHFNQAVATALDLPEAEAAELRVRIMRECSGRRDAGPEVTREILARASDALRPPAERIARDVQLCLRYFAVTFRGQRPDSVTLVGGEAYEPALGKQLSESLDVPCIVGHPMRGIAGVRGRGGRTLQPAWAVACGLALRGTRWVPSATALSSAMPRSSAAVGSSSSSRAAAATAGVA